MDTVYLEVVNHDADAPRHWLELIYLDVAYLGELRRR